MLAAVEFDDHPSVERGGIADIEADLVLAAKFEATDLPSAQTTPEKALSVGLISPEGADMAKHPGMSP